MESSRGCRPGGTCLHVVLAIEVVFAADGEKGRVFGANPLDLQREFESRVDFLVVHGEQLLPVRPAQTERCTSM